MKTKISKRTKAAILLATFLVAVGTATIVYVNTAKADMAQPYGNDYTTKYNTFTATITATDNSSGVDYTKVEVWYAVDPRHPFTLLSSETNYTEPLTYTTQGVYQFHYYSVDMIGNIEVRKIDTVILWNSDNESPWSQMIFT